MKIYSTLSAKKEEFKPSGDTVKMYVCGVTPYASAHLGHAMSYITFDVVRRYLEFRGYKVKHVQNFTDIDDKIIDRANRMGRLAKELAEGYIAEYFQDMDALNIRHAHVYPRATEEIPKIIEIVEGLISKGFAYSASGDVYFRVQKARGYGKLSHRTLDSMMAGARIEPGAQKEHPMDFALWKASKPGEPQWPSPWGQGRPGWHIECSAMSLKYLGESLDIHGGGQDLIFPHHENEIAQSESFTGAEPFARYWMHNGLLQMGEDKMSKSLGNLITVKEALSSYGADGLRIFVLGSHYRMPLKYSEEALSAAKRGAERIRYAAAVESKEGGEPLDASQYRDAFIASMDDDFNAPQGVASLFDLAREINREADGGQDVRKAQATLRELAEVLGLTLQPSKGVEGADAAPYIELLLETRRALREAKQWVLADKIRERLAELGVAIEDTPKGTVWKQK